MKIFILAVTLFLANGASVQYRVEPASFKDMNDCLHYADDSKTWYKTVLEKAGLKVTSGLVNCIVKDPNENPPIPVH